MVTTVALDTNIAIDLMNGKEETLQFVKQFQTVCLPVTVCGELLFGVKNSANRLLNEPRFNAFINNCIVLDANALVAEEYGELRLALKQKGKPIPENDIWIAAICIVNEIPLFSRDKHFEYVDQLVLIK